MTDEQILACNNTAAEDQEFSPCITAPDEDLIAFARQVLPVQTRRTAMRRPFSLMVAGTYAMSLDRN